MNLNESFAVHTPTSLQQFSRPRDSGHGIFRAEHRQWIHERRSPPHESRSAPNSSAVPSNTKYSPSTIGSASSLQPTLSAISRLPGRRACAHRPTSRRLAADRRLDGTRKYFVLTGQVPAVHPAAMFLLVAFLTMSVLFRKLFCGWLCPVGTISEYLYGGWA